MNHQERVCKQTNDEWLKEYNTGKPVYPVTVNNSPPVTNLDKENNLYIYDSHRTTRLSRGAFIFINTDTGEEAILWFNVDIYRKRGKRKGEPYRTGYKGQFYPKRRSKFRKFWMDVIGAEPYRWSIVYRQLKSRLKGLTFKCDTETAYDSKGNPYIKINTITLVDTNQAQKEHISGTNKAQEMCTRDTGNHTTDKAYTEFKVPNKESTLKPSYPMTQ